MKISFFEEFPTKENMEKIKLIEFPSTIYIATTSLKKFNSIIKNFQKKNIEYAYWPLLTKEEGYWMSALAETKGLKRIIDELNKVKKPLKVLWDAELPTLRKRLFVKNLFKIRKNREIINTFLEKTKLDILSAEYPIGNDWLFKKLAVRNPTNRAYMMYSSFLKNFESYLEKDMERIGVGCIATGILEKEKIISPEQLKDDLEIAKKSKIKEAIIFRLGGLNKDYIKIIKKINS